MDPQAPLSAGPPPEPVAPVAPQPPVQPPTPPDEQLQSLYASVDEPPQPPVAVAAPQSVAEPMPAAPPPAMPPMDQIVPAFDNIYTEICGQIMKEQGRIIGNSLAIEQASQVEGLTVDPETMHCTVVGDGSKVINDLIQKYSDFFGHAAVEVCREAASRFLVNLSTEQTPLLLRAN